MLLTVLSLVLAACGAADDVDGAADTTESAETTTPPGPTSTTRFEVDLIPSTTKVPPVTTPPSSADPGDEEPPAFSPGDDPVAFAVADLARMLGIAEDEITLVLQEEVTWRDGSLGCPLPGFSYTQALVDGSRIVLEAGGEEYSYHQAAGRAPFYCQNPAQ